MVIDKDVEKGYPTAIKLADRRTPYHLYVTPFDKIHRHEYRGEGTSEKPYIVDWLPDDPENPQTWNDMYKWFLTLFVAVATLAVSFCSSAYTGAINGLLQDYGASDEIATLGISLFVLGFALGEFTLLPFVQTFSISHRSSCLGSFF